MTNTPSGKMQAFAESLTPDAALLAEADEHVARGRKGYKLVQPLAAALREMQKALAIASDIKALADSEDAILRNYDAAILPLKERAEQAERERDALAAELQRLKEGKP